MDLDALYTAYLDDGGWLALAGAVTVVGAWRLALARRDRRGAVWGVIVAICLLTYVPALLASVGPPDLQERLAASKALLFFAGVGGGGLMLAALLGYRLTALPEGPSPLPPPSHPDSLDLTQMPPSARGQPVLTPRLGQDPVSPPEPGQTPHLAQEPVAAPVVDSPLPARRRVLAGHLVDLANTRRTYPIYAGENRLGRHRSSDVIINDPAVSRHHALIHCRDGRFTVEDTDSHSGILVNDRAVQGRTALLPGDVITVGDSRLRLDVAPTDDA